MTRGRESGFTLLEVLVAMAIFSIGALGVLGMVMSTMHLNQNSRQMTEATQLGIRQMERLQTLSLSAAEHANCATLCYLDPASTPPLGQTTTAKTVQPANNISGGAGSRLYYQVAWKSTTVNGLRYLNVTVYWPRERDLQNTPWEGSLDCVSNSGRCFSVQFHSYRS